MKTNLEDGIQILCLDCDKNLLIQKMLQDMLRIQCECGIIYSAMLLLNIDTAIWEKVRTERLFIRSGEEVLVVQPPEAIRTYPEWVAQQEERRTAND